jgi:hypothetical protein
VIFGSIVVVLFTASYLAGLRGVYSSSQHRLNAQLRDPATRVAATSELALQIANAIAVNHPVIPGASDEGSCPARYASRATSVVEAMAADEATATIAAAGTRLRDAGWRVDAAASGSGRRTIVNAHNRQGSVRSGAGERVNDDDHRVRGLSSGAESRSAGVNNHIAIPMQPAAA